MILLDGKHIKFYANTKLIPTVGASVANLRINYYEFRRLYKRIFKTYISAWTRWMEINHAHSNEIISNVKNEKCLRVMKAWQVKNERIHTCGAAYSYHILMSKSSG